MSSFLDSFFSGIDSFIMQILNWLLGIFQAILSVIFATNFSAKLFGFVFINAIGFYFMYLDKKNAQEEKRRIPERTLFLIALLFGSFGIFAGMYKFHHKTLHKTFTIGIPLIMAAQIIFIIYSLIKGWLF